MLTMPVPMVVENHLSSWSVDRSEIIMVRAKDLHHSVNSKRDVLVSDWLIVVSFAQRIGDGIWLGLLGWV